MSQSRDRGAAAVEFALVLPVLLILVLGIIEFGRAYNQLTTLSQAAREGVRVMALTNDAQLALQTTKNAAAPAVTLNAHEIVITACPAAPTTLPSNATVTITHNLSHITRFFSSAPLKLTGRGVMRCNG